MGNKHKRRARRGEIRVADGGGYWVNDAELERLKSGTSGNNA